MLKHLRISNIQIFVNAESKICPSDQLFKTLFLLVYKADQLRIKAIVHIYKKCIERLFYKNGLFPTFFFSFNSYQ